MAGRSTGTERAAKRERRRLRSAIPGTIRVGAEPRVLEAPRRFPPRERISAPIVLGEDAEADQSVAILVTDLEKGRGRVLGVERDLAHGVARLFADPGRRQVIRRRGPGPSLGDGPRLRLGRLPSLFPFTGRALAALAALHPDPHGTLFAEHCSGDEAQVLRPPK